METLLHWLSKLGDFLDQSTRPPAMEISNRQIIFIIPIADSAFCLPIQYYYLYKISQVAIFYLEGTSRMSGLTGGDGGSEADSSVIVTYTGSTDIFGEGALDVPGATVEVVETDPHPISSSGVAKECRKGAPAYRQRLLLK